MTRSVQHIIDISMLAHTMSSEGLVEVVRGGLSLERVPYPVTSPAEVAECLAEMIPSAVDDPERGLAEADDVIARFRPVAPHVQTLMSVRDLSRALQAAKAYSIDDHPEMVEEPAYDPIEQRFHQDLKLVRIASGEAQTFYQRVSKRPWRGLSPAIFEQRPEDVESALLDVVMQAAGVDREEASYLRDRYFVAANDLLAMVENPDATSADKAAFLKDWNAKQRLSFLQVNPDEIFIAKPGVTKAHILDRMPDVLKAAESNLTASYDAAHAACANNHNSTPDMAHL